MREIYNNISLNMSFVGIACFFVLIILGVVGIVVFNPEYNHFAVIMIYAYLIVAAPIFLFALKKSPLSKRNFFLKILKPSKSFIAGYALALISYSTLAYFSVFKINIFLADTIWNILSVGFCILLVMGFLLSIFSNDKPAENKLSNSLFGFLVAFVVVNFCYFSVFIFTPISNKLYVAYSPLTNFIRIDKLEINTQANKLKGEPIAFLEKNLNSDKDPKKVVEDFQNKYL